MAAVREKHNTSYLSEAVAPTSLEDYVRLYNKAGRLCYIDYMEGAKALYKFLSPICIPQLVPRKMHKMPALFHGYEVQQVAYIVSGETYGDKYKHIENLILHYTAKHILEGVIS